MTRDVTFDVILGNAARDQRRAFPIGKAAKEFANLGNKGRGDDVGGKDG